VESRRSLIFPFSSPSDIVWTMSFENQILASKDFFERSTRVMEEADSGFRPREGMMTVAQQVAHTAQTLEWFIDGVVRPAGFDLDFEKHAGEVAKVTSLGAARRRWMRLTRRCWSSYRFAQPGAARGARSRPARLWVASRLATSYGAMVEHTAHIGAHSQCTRGCSEKFRQCLRRLTRPGLRHLGGIVEGELDFDGLAGSMVIGSGLGGGLVYMPREEPDGGGRIGRRIRPLGRRR